MSKRSKTISAVLVVVVVLGVAAVVFGPKIYRDLIVGPPAAAPALSTPSQTQTDAVAPASGNVVADPSTLNGQWVVGANSFAGYRVDEVLNGTNVTVTGRTEKVSGSLALASGMLNNAEITVDMASVATDSSKRDSYFRDNAIRANQFPTATFTLTEPVSVAELATDNQATRVELKGQLTIAGVTNDVTVSADARRSGDSAEVATQIPITFADFGVEAPDLGFVQVEQDGFIDLQLTLLRR